MGGEGDPGSGKRPAGDPYLVTAPVLAQELEGKPNRLVFLAACRTGTGTPSKEVSGLLAGFAQELAAQANLPAIVAMQYPISDVQANQLTARFLESLAALYPVDVALSEARKSLVRRGLAGRDIIAPVMYLQAEDGALFQWARNWVAIGATAFAVLEMTAFIIQTLLFQPDRQKITNAQRTAQAETTGRAIAQVTAQAEATERAIAQAQAEASSQEAEQQRQVALARRLAEQARQVMDQTPSRLPLATLLAIESMQRYPEMSAYQVLAQALEILPHEVLRLKNDGLGLAYMALSPDGQQVVFGNGYTALAWEVTMGQEIARMTHDDELRAMTFNPDGQWVVLGSVDHTARVWEAATGREIARMTHDGVVNTVAFSPDGRWVVSGSLDSTARVWEVSTGREIARVTHDSGAVVETAVFSPDGQWVASGDTFGIIRVWEAPTGQEIAQMEHDAEVYALTFSSDGQRLASLGCDDMAVSQPICNEGSARAWEVATGRELARMTYKGEFEMSPVAILAFSQDGQWVVSGGGDGIAQVWEAATGQEIARMTHDDGAVSTVAFSPDGRWIASGGSRAVRVWEAATGREIARMTHDDGVRAAAFSPDGRWVVSGGNEGVRVWEVTMGREVARMKLNDSVTSLTLSPDRQWVVIGAEDGTARVWEPITGDEVAWKAHDLFVMDMTFSPDGKWVASGGLDGSVQVWEAATGREIARMEHEEGENDLASNIVEAVAFSPDGRWVASGSKDRTARVWEAATGREVAQVVHDWPVVDVDFSPDSRWVVSIEGHLPYAEWGTPTTVRVWEATTGQEIARATHEGFVDHRLDRGLVAFSPDGRWVLSADGNTALVWEAATGREVARVEGGAEHLSFSPDGLLIASVGGIWEAATGRDIAGIPHNALVNSVAFSPDGRWVVSGGDDNTARVWEAATGREIARMTHDNRVSIVAFGPDGQWVVSVSGTINDDIVRVWLWQTEDLIDLACSRLTRNITHDEWEQYFGDEEPYRPTCPNLLTPES